MSVNKYYSVFAVGITLFLAAAFSLSLPVWTGSNVCGAVSSAQLIAEDGSDVGNVLIWNTQSRVHTRFDPAPGWKIAEVAYQPARFLSALPMRADGALSYADFGVQRTYRNPINSVTFQTAMDWELGDDLHLAGRAVLIQYDDNGNQINRVVAWGDGKTYSQTAPYFKHIVQPCSD